MHEIHGAAFVRDESQRLSIPAIALLMLRTYILHYPDLQQALALAYRKFRNTTSVLMALRKATQLIYTFLDFHGLRHDHPDCQVRITPPDLDGERCSDFAVQVRLQLPRPTDEETTPTWAQFEGRTAEALAWVLQQLIDYPQIVGIDEKAEKPGNSAASGKQPQRRSG